MSLLFTKFFNQIASQRPVITGAHIPQDQIARRGGSDFPSVMSAFLPIEVCLSTN
jgi:hypothetical protein